MTDLSKYRWGGNVTEALDRLRRWIRPSTQPVYLRLEHPVQDDMAFAADTLQYVSNRLHEQELDAIDLDAFGAACVRVGLEMAADQSDFEAQHDTAHAIRDLATFPEAIAEAVAQVKGEAG